MSKNLLKLDMPLAVGLGDDFLTSPASMFLAAVFAAGQDFDTAAWGPLQFLQVGLMLLFLYALHTVKR